MLGLDVGIDEDWRFAGFYSARVAANNNVVKEARVGAC
jgi:hypothetical protein